MNESDIEEFLASYIGTALWSSTTGEDSIPLDDEQFCDTEWSDEGMAKMRADCLKFIKFCEQIELPDEANLTSYGLVEMAAHDFWLTRNGHGCGYWDGDWEEPWASRLTKASKAFGEAWIYIGDDGKFYVA